MAAEHQRAAGHYATGCVLAIFFFQAEDGIRDVAVTGVQTCALPILRSSARTPGTASWGWGARGVAFENDRRSWTRHSPLAGAGCRLDLACAAQHHLL